MDFLKWYKNLVESAREEPPAKVWEEIQDELDVDNVWNNIEGELSRSKRRTMFHKFAAAASLLLIIGSGIMFYNIIFDDTTYDTYVIEGLEVEEYDTTQEMEQQEPTRTQIAVHEEDFDDKIIELADQDIKGLPLGEDIEHPLPITEPLPGIAYPPGISISAPNIKTRKEQFQILIPLDQTEEKIKHEGTYFAGLSGHAANTWLLNNKTLQGIQSDNLTATLPSFGYNLGIVAGRNLKDNFSIQSELYFISQSKQGYNEYLHGQYINNNLLLNYSSLTLSGRWSFKETTTGNSHALIIGAYSSILKNAKQNLNGTKISLTNEYNTFDYGVMAGYEYMYDVGDNLIMGTGVQTHYGLKNIFSGNEYVPSYLNSTRNMSINFVLSLKYSFN